VENIRIIIEEYSSRALGGLGNSLVSISLRYGAISATGYPETAGQNPKKEMVWRA